MCPQGVDPHNDENSSITTLNTPLSGGELFRFWGPGDSLGEGFNGGDQAAGHGYQYPLYQEIRAVRGDICTVGTKFFDDYGTAGLNNPIDTVFPGDYSAMDWENEGHSGSTMADLETNIPGWLITIGVIPDIVFICIGSNTNGHTPTQMATIDLPSLIQSIRSQLPLSRIIISTVPPQGAGAVTLAAYNNLLISRAATNQSPFNMQYVYFVDCCSDFTIAECGPDFSVHPNQFGYAKMASRIIPVIERILGPRKGLVYPRPQNRPRVFNTMQGIIFNSPEATATGNNTGCYVGNDSFSIELEIVPLNPAIEKALVTATLEHVISLGDYYVTGFTIYANGNALSVYLDAGAPVFQDIPGCFNKTGQPITINVHCDNTNNICSLWVDGTLRAISQHSSWNLPLAGSIILGANPFLGAPAFQCIIRNIRIYHGATGMPLYETGTLRLKMESSSCDGVPLAGTTAWFKCDDDSTGNTVADYFGGTPLTLNDGAEFAYTPEPGALIYSGEPVKLIENEGNIPAREIIGNNCILDLDASVTASITFSSGKISNWQDQSFRGAHSFSQTVAGNRPSYSDDAINGRPAIIFSPQETSKLTCPDTLSEFIENNEWHLFIVAEYDSIAGTSEPFRYTNDCIICSSSTRWGVSARQNDEDPSSSGKYSGWKVHAGPAYDNSDEIKITVGLPFLLEYKFNPNNLFSVRAMGGLLNVTPQEYQSITAPGVVDDLTDTMIIGADFSSVLYSDIRIAKIVIAKTELNNKLASRLRANLRQFYMF